MAEAHSAVAFSFAITHDGWDVNFDREVLYLVWESGVRSWKKRLARFRNSVHNGVYPGHLQSLYVLWSMLVAAHFSGLNIIPFGLVGKAMAILPGETAVWQVAACLIAALTMWLSVIFLMRYMLKMLLMYKGWMYESRVPGAKISLKTKLWVSVVKVLSGWNKPKLYSFQGSLPRLPLPKVKDTMRRYLVSVRPLLDDDNYARVEKKAREFEQTIAVKLQRYLVLKSWWSSNYVSDWWEEYVYLRGRSPLMVNSNFYGIDTICSKSTRKQAARAAVVVHLCLQFRRLIDRQELEPIMLQNMVPLCSWQYERLFNTVRVPGVETDKIVHYHDSNHITVFHRGRYYKVVVYSRGRMLKPAEIQVQMEAILNDPSPPCPNEERLAAFTAGERSHWAHARQTLFNRGHNRTSLHCIERAAFNVCLDDVEYRIDENPKNLEPVGRLLLHGNGHDRWFDKSFNLCFSTDGFVGFNAEHTWADAPVMGHLWEYVIWTELEGSYNSKGDALGTVETPPPPPTRLQWELQSEPLVKALDTSYEVSQKILNDVDLRILMYTKYGKGFMKKCRTSPDGFIQLILQLSYYRDAGRFCLTYEASMTRMFREGRTETVRPCTIESAAWVKAMVDPKVSVEERMRLFRAATHRHQLGYQDAMCGQGIDRHLFCLYVVSKYLELDSPFLQEVFNEPWRLSTSQTPHGQTSKLDLKNHPECISAGGGFGPVADDGYGVSYIIAGDDTLFFHVSCNKTCPKTSASNFVKEIERSLADVKEMFLTYNKLQEKKA
ncbi:hypothetical protein JYU34_000799 [Plutella xylostella]|uniref:Carnitine O-palmitoyltransferase n=1 Tax=Plutella xylostella TaxID=51655 RepID=A0ABQ7R8M7_PLUXY|nr:hypothetical protein JYU34_000799 [Plutella xylostella]